MQQQHQQHNNNNKQTLASFSSRELREKYEIPGVFLIENFVTTIIIINRIVVACSCVYIVLVVVLKVFRVQNFA